MEEEKVNEAEDTTLRIICGQSFPQDGTEEELTRVKVIRFRNSLSRSTYDGPAKPRVTKLPNV